MMPPTQEVPPHAPSSQRPLLSEETEIHTRLLRLALGVEESRAYWANIDPSLLPAPRALAAFEQRWFGAKSLERVRTLLANFSARYDAYPQALAVLRRWPLMQPPERRALCHWHLQLSDPMYRLFTGSFLVERREAAQPTVDRDVVLRWVQRTWPERWAPATCVQFASKLLSAASEAGLVSPRKEPRQLLSPKVPDTALAYLLYLLREVRFEGSLLDNPYLTSLGLSGALLEQRLRSLPGLSFHRMGALTEFDWAAPSLTAWAEAFLAPSNVGGHA